MDYATLGLDFSPSCPASGKIQEARQRSERCGGGAISRMALVAADIQIAARVLRQQVGNRDQGAGFAPPYVSQRLPARPEQFSSATYTIAFLGAAALYPKSSNTAFGSEYGITISVVDNRYQLHVQN